MRLREENEVIVGRVGEGTIRGSEGARENDVDEVRDKGRLRGRRVGT